MQLGLSDAGLFARADALRPFCIEWIGGRDRRGYGKRWNPETRQMDNAHRMAWAEANHRPVPAGWHVDHLCRNPRCINPDHLEAVTASENNKRGLNGVPYQFCKNGHAKTLDNTNVIRGKRNCLTCERARKRRHALKIRGQS